jgi:hypothetical protein
LLGDQKEEQEDSGNRFSIPFPLTLVDQRTMLTAESTPWP